VSDVGSSDPSKPLARSLGGAKLFIPQPPQLSRVCNLVGFEVVGFEFRGLSSGFSMLGIMQALRFQGSRSKLQPSCIGLKSLGCSQQTIGFGFDIEMLRK